MNARDRTRLVVFVIASIVGVHVRAGPAIPAASTWQEVVPNTTDQPLLNRGAGLYLDGTLNPADLPPGGWVSRACAIGYFRDDWSRLQPDREGVGQFDAYFQPIFDLWVRRWGHRVAFRFMASNMHSRRKYVTPKWVFDQGVPGVEHRAIDGRTQVDPVFWDERYLAVQERFIAELGKYLDGKEGLEFLDVGGIGEWGEMHLSRWSPEQLERAGYSETRYIAAYRRLIDAFARAFPRTRVFLNVGRFATINDYAAIRGLHFRQDGLTPSGPSADVGERFFRPYARRGVVCNYELHSDLDAMKKQGWGVRETLARGLEDPISYLHINLMSARDLQAAPPDVRTAVIGAARRVGSRFVLTHLRCNRSLRINGRAPARLLLDQTWKNVGVAPCYESYALRWSLRNDRGEVAAEPMVYPEIPTTRWWPGEEIKLHDVLLIPASLPPGSYRLSVAMARSEEPRATVELGLSGRDVQGRYDLAGLTAIKGDAPGAIVYEENFEAAENRWKAAEGMAVKVVSEAHAGRGCLLVSGTQSGTSWNYAELTSEQPLLPASRYRLSCWMQVNSLRPALPPPSLKLGLINSRHQWISNLNTASYDLNKLGTWQHLSGVVETTADTASGQLTVEKGALQPKISTTLKLDEIRLELVESP